MRQLTGLSGCAATASSARRSASCAASRVAGKSAGLKEGYSVGAGRTALRLVNTFQSWSLHSCTPITDKTQQAAACVSGDVMGDASDHPFSIKACATTSC